MQRIPEGAPQDEVPKQTTDQGHFTCIQSGSRLPSVRIPDLVGQESSSKQKAAVALQGALVGVICSRTEQEG